MRRHSEFPALQAEAQRLYLDSAATTLTPQVVLDAVRDSMVSGGSAGRSVHRRGQGAEERLESARAALAHRLGTLPSELVITSSATEALNLVAWGWGLPNLRPGQRILVSALEHHASLLPWRAVARETGARVHTLPCTPSGELDLDALDAALTHAPAVLALGWVSNLTGGVAPLPEILRRVRARAPECLVVVDGSQALGHLPIDLSALGADFVAFAGHKAYGPLGVGLLHGQPERWAQTRPLHWGGGMVRAVEQGTPHLQPAPWCFEAGTPNHHAAIGLAAAIPYWDQGQPDLVDGTCVALETLPGCQVVGSPSRRVGLISFTLLGLHPHDVGSVLDSLGIEVRVGHLCAQPALEALGIGAAIRASFGVYNEPADIARLIDGLQQAQRTLKART
ncbi:MAG: aminotransferase class V-fold PLP-dependent enzyme [Myxococcota bacterium]|nr:aminotransferase class V-fold PLP-dependent enzyme [Myxococcota bacterium]